MFKWNNKKNVNLMTKTTYKQRIIGFMDGLVHLYQNILTKNFNFITTLRKHLYGFQVNSNIRFIGVDNYDEENLCQICLMPLLGPCSTFACDCHLTLHEGCLFRLILGGFNKCPQCKLQLCLEKYKPRIDYPKTLKCESIYNELLMIVNDDKCEKKINIDKVLNHIQNDCVLEVEKLNEIYFR